MNKIAITMGDPNSIAPEVIIKALNKLDLDCQNVVLIANKVIFDFYENNYNLKLSKNYPLVEIPFNEKQIQIGKETKEAGEFSFGAIEKACELANKHQIKSIVTGPVSKYAMNLAGHHFAGQTEIIEQFTRKPEQTAEMLFVSGNIKLLLLTRHVAVKEIPDLLKKDIIISKIESLTKELQEKFDLKTPKIALCSLNPHSGENGLFGTEEQTELLPAIKELNEKGITIEGAFPADGLFAKLADTIKDGKKPYYDCYVACYHDQGLIPIKMLGMNKTVNCTIGLDKLRTSPAHGTAFDIAGQIKADETSMLNAIKLAL